MYDIVIQNAFVLDGTGAEGFVCDVAIRDGKIAKLAQGTTDAAKVINARGLTLTPGFIDSHSHYDIAVLKDPDQQEVVEQGITFSVAGNCGASLAPDVHGRTGLSVEAFFQRVQQSPIGCNFALLVGAGTIRKEIAGYENRAATEEELIQMEALLDICMQCGAIGLSLGLIYAPGSYADPQELMRLARVVKRYDGIISAHIRNENDFVVESVEEFISVIRGSGCRGVLSHHKAADKPNWGKVKKTLSLVEQASREGLDIYVDAYPYTASLTSLKARFIPSFLHPPGTTDPISLLDDPSMRQKLKSWAQNRWGNDLSWVLVTTSIHPEYNGKNVNEIAQMMGLEDRCEAVYRLLQESPSARACYTMMAEDDVRYILAHPRAMIGTDFNISGRPEKYHPRLRGTFPRVLGRYVREEKVTTLPEMIRKMTFLPAQVYKLPGKGRIAEGYDGDICIFDPEKIRDNADYVNCSLPNEGIHYVLIDGKVVVENNRYNGTRAGRLFVR